MHNGLSTGAANGEHVRFKWFVSSSSFLSFLAASLHVCVCVWTLTSLWGGSLELLDVRGQTIERHVLPRWRDDQPIGVCSYAVTGMNPFLLPAVLKLHPHIKNLITLTQIFNPLDQVSPNPVLEVPNWAGFSILPGGSHVQESFVNLVGQKSFLMGVWLCFWFNLTDDLECGTVVLVDQKLDFF